VNDTVDKMEDMGSSIRDGLDESNDMVDCKRGELDEVEDIDICEIWLKCILIWGWRCRPLDRTQKRNDEDVSLIRVTRQG